MILGNKMGTTFPVSIQHKEVNALLDTEELHVHRHVHKIKTIIKHRESTNTQKCIRKRYEDPWSDDSQI